MAERGRKSAASLSVVGPTLVHRLAPPTGLTNCQRAVWLATVNAKPADWFGPEHAPILGEYVKHVETALVLTEEIDGFDPGWLKDDDGLKRFDRLTSMRAREAGVINTLARSMRLTQQAQIRADAAGAKKRLGGGAKPWQVVDG